MVKAKLIGHNTNWELTIIVKHRKRSTVIYHKVTNEQKRPKKASLNIHTKDVP